MLGRNDAPQVAKGKGDHGDGHADPDLASKRRNAAARGLREPYRLLDGRICGRFGIARELKQNILDSNDPTSAQ